MKRKTKQKGEPKDKKNEDDMSSQKQAHATGHSDKQQPVFMWQAPLYSLNVECQITEVCI